MNAPIDITAHFSMDMYLETCAFVPFPPSLSLWRRRFSRFFSPRFLRFSTQRIADRNLNFLETFWKFTAFVQLCFLFRKFPSMNRMLMPLSIWRSILDSDRSIYIFNYFFWVYNSIVEIGMKRKTFSAISTPWLRSIRGTVSVNRATDIDLRSRNRYRDVHARHSSRLV